MIYACAKQDPEATVQGGWVAKPGTQNHFQVGPTAPRHLLSPDKFHSSPFPSLEINLPQLGAKRGTDSRPADPTEKHVRTGTTQNKSASLIKLMLNPTTKTLVFSNRFRMGFHCCLWTLMGWSWTMSCSLYSERCDKELSDLNFSTQSIYLSFKISYIRRLRLQDEKVSKFCPGAALSVLLCKTPACLSPENFHEAQVQIWEAAPFNLLRNEKLTVTSSSVELARKCEILEHWKLLFCLGSLGHLHLISMESYICLELPLKLIFSPRKRGRRKKQIKTVPHSK